MKEYVGVHSESIVPSEMVNDVKQKKIHLSLVTN